MLAYANGMTIQKMCEAAKVSAGIIGDLKHGRRNNLGSITVDKLIKVLGCTAEDILHDPVTEKPMPDAPKADRSQHLYIEALTAMKERPEMRRLIRAALVANTQQVKSTAILLESITKANAEGGIFTDDVE